MYGLTVEGGGESQPGNTGASVRRVVPLVYHPRYNITAFGLERLHPFDSRKYRRIHDALVARGIRSPGDFVRPRSPQERELLRVHTPDYLHSLRSPAVLAGILGLPIVARLPGRLVDWRVLSPMRLAVGGTVLARPAGPG